MTPLNRRAAPKRDHLLLLSGGPIIINNGTYLGFPCVLKEAPFGFPNDLLARGIALASIKYRLSGEAIFPARIQDCKAAVRFLRANSTKYKLDFDRIAVMGDSAGAHLASLVATTSDVKIWDTPTMPNPTVSSRVLALVALAPPTSVFDGPAESAFATLLGYSSVEACPDKVKEASPLTYVTPDDPPAVLFQGTDDPTVDHENARIFDEALVRANVHVMYRVMQGVAHVDDPAYQSLQVKGVIADFLDRVMSGTPPSATASDFEFARFGPNQYGAMFGSYFGNQQVLPDPGPLPSALGGFSVNIRDSAGRTQGAGLYALLPGELNLLLPSGLAPGAAALTVLRNGQAVASEQVRIADPVPTLFAAYVNGAALALGQAYLVDVAGHQQWQSLVVQNESQLQMAAYRFRSPSDR
jgi:hypothetical protein